MSEYFRWVNCFADVNATRCPDTIRAYVREVVWPSLDSLDRQIQVWNESGDAAAAFAVADIDDLRRSTTEAFCLAIQSLWERQLRDYVYTAARQLAPGSEKRARVAKWDDLLELFASLRGIALQDFAQFDALKDLHLLGNVCRHGDGPSLNKLMERRPGLWPGPREQFDMDFKLYKVDLGVDNMEVTRELLAELSEAVATFWEVMDYIYLESLTTKHESVEMRLPELRRSRAGQIRVNAGGG